MPDLNIQQAAKKAGDEVLLEVKTALYDEWDAIPATVKDDIAQAALRVGELTLREFAGEDVTTQMALVHSTVRDFKTAGKLKSAVVAARVENAFWKGVSKVAESLATFLRIFGQGALKGLLGGLA